MRLYHLSATCLVVIGALVSPSLTAADLPGSKDHPLLKRFGGSEIVAFETKRFEEYELQISTFKHYDIDARQRSFASPSLKIEGSLTRIWYEAAGEASSTELIRNYQNELKAKGFQVMYDSTKDPAAKSWVNFLSLFGGSDIKTNRSPYVFIAADVRGIRVVSAKLERPEGNVFVYLTAIEWPKDDTTYKSRKGAYIAVDIIESKPMTQNMVVVSADEMSKAIAATGRVALYGIHFDTNKAEIKPESKAALDEIAKYLKVNANAKLQVVGHTDNVGGLDSNLGLSKRRAEAVVASLTKQYGVGANRLNANGVAYLAPVAVNTSEEGRAKNRRVELVPQ